MKGRREEGKEKRKREVNEGKDVETGKRKRDVGGWYLERRRREERAKKERRKGTGRQRD